MTCDHVLKALMQFRECSETPDGSRVKTTCLYPSFEPVEVFVTKLGEGFQVHDAGQARSIAWLHGRYDRLTERQLMREAEHFGITYEEGRLLCKVDSEEWLASAILSVANASAIGAYNAVEKAVQAAEEGLKDRIDITLRKHVPEKRLAHEYKHAGSSGKEHSFDFAIIAESEFVTLIDAVAAHHVSVSSRYVAFSDVMARLGTDRVAVHDNFIQPEDKALLLQVAEVLPFADLEPLVPSMVRRVQAHR